MPGHSRQPDPATPAAGDAQRDRFSWSAARLAELGFGAHSMFDAELYRDKAEVEMWKQRCPIAAFERHVAGLGLAIDRDVDAELAAAIAYAETGSWEPVDELTRHVMAEPTPTQQQGARP